MTLQSRPYRYQLPKKAVKADCPECGSKHRKTLSRYVDSKTDEALPEPYGRCDRESNCGYHLSPYHKGPSGISYADEVYEQRKNEQTSEWPRRPAPRSAKPAPNVERPVCSIPDEVFAKSLGHYDRNQFARLLRKQFGTNTADGLLSQFQIGTSARWVNACVFWLIDEQGRKRGGQIKQFDETFHTVKYVDQDGRRRTRTSWVHSALTYLYKKQDQPQPDWLTAYVDQGEFAPCLFGLPQLQSAPVDQPVAIVEAPKTAVLCTPYFPQFTWLAAVGRSYLNAERLASIKGRTIVLFPDLSDQGKDYLYWKEKANGLRQQGFKIVVSDYLEKLATDEQRAGGLDLADFLLRTGPDASPKIVRTLAEWVAGTILRPDESELERLPVEFGDDYPPEWDTPGDVDSIRLASSPNRDEFAQAMNVEPAALPLYILERTAITSRELRPHAYFPPAPLAFDAAEQLRAVRYCVLPPGADTDNQ